MRGLARIYDVRMAQFVLKIEKLSHIMGPRASQDLRSPSPIMAPVSNKFGLAQNFLDMAHECFKEPFNQLSGVSGLESGAG